MVKSDHWGYKQDDMVILTDDATNPRMQPTTANIVCIPLFHAPLLVQPLLDSSDAMARQ